jgi:hypothetical protein
MMPAPWTPRKIARISKTTFVSDDMPSRSASISIKDPPIVSAIRMMEFHLCLRGNDYDFGVILYPQTLIGAIKNK